MADQLQLSDIKGYYFTTSDISKSVISDKIKVIAKDYLLNEQRSIQHVIERYQESTDKYLFALFCVKTDEPKENDQNEQWICLKIMKKFDPVNNGIDINEIFPLLNPAVHVARLFAADMTRLNTEQVASFVIEKFNREEALQTIENILKHRFNEKFVEITLIQTQSSSEGIRVVIKKIFDTLDIQDEALTQIFDQGIVEQGLCAKENARMKPSFKKVLTSLESLLKMRPKFTIDRTHFANLCKKLNSANFIPVAEDKVDLRVKTLKLIVQLKENGQLVDKQLLKDDLKKNNGFLQKGKGIFVDQILEFDEQLREDPRNFKAKGCLKLAINDRIEYLSNKNKLVPDLVTPGDVFEMFGHFLLEEGIEHQKKERETLENKCLENASDTKNEETMIGEAIDDSTKLQEIHHQLEYLEVKYSIRFDCNFQELIPVLASKILDELILPHNVLSKIFDIGQKFVSEALVTNVVQILLALPTTSYDQIKDRNFPEKFYQYLTRDTEKQLIYLTNRGFFGTEYSDTLVDFLITTLIENEDENMRSSALEALTRVKKPLSDEFNGIIDIETKLQENSNSKGFLQKLTKKDLTKEMLSHVQKSYRLTWNCFESLVSSDINEEKMLIIETIVDNDLQTLPQFFVKSIKTDILSISIGDVTWKEKVGRFFTKTDVINVMLKVFEIMIIGNYMKMSELNVESILSFIEDEKYRENALLIVLTATRMGEKIPDEFMRTIKAIQPKSGLVINCIRALTKEETALDVLRNSKKSIEERKSAMQKLVQDQTFQDEYTLGIMMNLVKFDQDLRDDAFVSFLEMVSAETWQSCEIKFPEMIQSMKMIDSKVPVQAMNKFLKKDLRTNTKPMIDYLIYRTFTGDIDVQRECILTLKEVLQKSNPEYEMWINHLITIIRFSRSENIKRSVLDLIDKSFNVEDFKQSLKVTITEVRAILNEKIDEHLLMELVPMVNKGFVVPESLIHKIIQKLTVPEYSKLNLVSNVLFLIHSKQKLKQETFVMIVSTIEKCPQLLQNFQLVSLLLEGLNLNVVKDLSLEMIEKLMGVLKDGNHELKLVALEILRICFATYCYEQDLFAVKHCLSMILQELCLEKVSINKDLVVIQKKIALETLLSIDASISLDNIFIKNYYQQLKPLLVTPSKETDLEKLDSYILNTSKTNRIRVLFALTISIMCQHQINTEIFVHKNESEWQKALLCDILVKAVFQRSTNLNEFALEDFLNDLTKLEVRLTNIGSDYRVEAVLEYLIENKCAVTFDYLSDILCLLQDQEAIEIFFTKQMNFDTKMLKLKENFLRKCLPSLSSTELELLTKELLKYQMRTVEKLIGSPFEYDSPENIINFFKTVNMHLPKKRQGPFLREITWIRSVQGWNQALSKKIVDRLVKKKLQGIKAIVSVDTVNSLIQKLCRTLDSSWSLRSIEMIADRINFTDTESLENASLSLDTIHEYKLKEYDSNVKGRALFEIISGSEGKNWDKMFHDIAIFQTFPGTYQKPLTQLVEEIVKLNVGQKIEYRKGERSIIEDYDKVVKAYNNLSTLKISESKTISEWKDDSIKSWSEKAKTHFGNIIDNEAQSFLYETIAVTMQAVKVINKFLPRDVQLLSLLCILNTSPNKGRLAQINTGEGKTTIIAMLAVIKALQGHTVDIITSSTELAKPQSVEQEPFYSLFNVSVSHNGDNQEDIKERYKSTVLYGAADCFQGDILRDEYSKLGTRSGRKCDLAIVDEVDSMLIDGKNHIVMLSSFMPAMNYLETLLAAIYIHIGVVADTIVETNGETYYIDRQDRIGDDGKILNDVKDNFVKLKTTKAEFIKKSTENHIRKVLRDRKGLESFPENEREIPDKYAKLPAPKHLYELVTRVQLKKWISSAIYAMFRCEHNKHYVLTKDGKIAPVDATNTGVIQQNMHWNNGLHQFLQIKHGAKITPENLTTNFISNVSFFQRYGANIYGLTGTLGSADSINLLNKTYSVDSVIIPPFKQKQHHELSPIINAKADDWYESIIESTLQKLRHGRGVLIIARYIDQVDTIYNKMLEAKYDPKKIKVYKTQSESDSVHAELKAGEVIIATNIAGRGTDIKPSSKIEENGGLHVCLTFLPDNKRVEEQNVGRTSRTGNKGTSQFILLEPSGRSLNRLRDDRNQKETKALESAETEIQRVCSKDAIFFEFCKFLDSFGKENIRPVEERFGIWLQMNVDKFYSESKETLISLFETSFKEEVTKDKDTENFVQNICFHIANANSLLKSEKFKDAVGECSKAIEKDPEFAEIAHYNRAYCRIAEYGGDSFYKSLNKDEVEAAQKDLIAARKIINKRLLELQIIQKASDGPKLSEQVKNKSTLYNVQLGTIRQAIGLDLVEADEELKQLEKNQTKIEEILTKETKEKLEVKRTKEQKERFEELKTNLEDIKQRIEDLKKEQKEDVGGVIGKALRGECDIRIKLLELEKTLPSDQDIQYYTDEIDEFKSNGLIGNFNISELQPIPWGQVALMAFIGLIQIAAGALLTVFTAGAGASFGVSLMLEGVSDLVTAVKDGILNRNIDWKNWAIQKAVSLTVSLVLCGMSGIKDVAKTAQAGGQVVAQGAVVSTVKQGVMKAGLKLALKNASFQLAKGVAREMLTALASEGLERTLMKEIEEYLVNRLQPNIYKALKNNPNVQRMLAIDLQNRNQYFQSLICNEAMKILSPKNKKDGLDAADVGKMFATRIANAKIKGLGMAMQLMEAGNAIYELIQFEEKFLNSLDESINKIMKDKKKEIDKSESKDDTSGGNGTQSSYKASTQTSSQTSRNIDTPDYTETDDIDTSKAKQRQEQATTLQGNVSPKKMCTSISEKVSNTMTNIIKGKIVMPVTHVAINFGMDKVTAGVEQSLARETQTYRDDRVTSFMLSGDKDNRVPSEIKEARAKDPKFIEKARQEASKEIDKLKNGGEAGVIEMHAVSENIKQKIIIYDKDGNVSRVINEHLSGAPVKVEYHPAQNGQPAHWTLPGGMEPQNNSRGNNCLFDCIADQTGQKPDDLRAGTAETMTRNIDRLAIVMPEVQNVRQFKSEWQMYGGANKRRKLNDIVNGEEPELPKRTTETKSAMELMTETNKNKRKHFENDTSTVDITTTRNENGDIIQVSSNVLITPGTIKKGEGRLSTPDTQERRERFDNVGIGPGKDAAHVNANVLGGTSHPHNFVGMSPKVNRGEMSVNEQALANKISSENKAFIGTRIADLNRNDNSGLPNLSNFASVGPFVDSYGNIDSDSWYEAYYFDSDSNDKNNN